MGLSLDPALSEAAAFCGVQWPSVDEDSLVGAGGVWSRYAATAAEYVQRCDQAVEHVTGRNEGPAVRAFAGHVAKYENGTATLRDFAASAPEVAAGFLRTARVIETGKAAVLSELALMAGFMARAEQVGSSAVGPLLRLRAQIRQRVDAIWDRTAEAIRNGQ